MDYKIQFNNNILLDARMWLLCPKLMMVNILFRDTATAFLGCGEKTAKTEGIVKPAAIQMRSPVGEPQCGNIEWERSRGGGDDGEKEIGGAVCPRDKVERISSEDDGRRMQAFTCGWRWAK